MEGLTMTKEEAKKRCYTILARDMCAQCPADINKRQFAAVKATMRRRFMAAWMDTPAGLYSDAQVWAQCFHAFRN
jgi:hypothetical protein